MDGWIHLPRYIDKIRLHLAGKLASDYQANLGKGFDGSWLKAAGVTHEQMVEVVKSSVTDGEVCDWMHQHVKKTPAEKAAHAQEQLSRPKADDPAGQERFKTRLAESGLAHRADLKTFVDYIDADEKRAYRISAGSWAMRVTSQNLSGSTGIGAGGGRAYARHVPNVLRRGIFA